MKKNTRSSRNKKAARVGAQAHHDTPEDDANNITLRKVEISENEAVDDDICNARFMLQEKSYEAALQYYDKAISRSSQNSLAIQKERESVHFLMYGNIDDSSWDPVHQYVNEMSYAKREARSKQQTNAPTEHVNVLGGSEELLAEQDLLILGYAFYYGWGTMKSYSKAFQYFQKAATGRTTNTEAKYVIAKMMITGIGTAPNTEEAISILQEIALLPHQNPLDMFNNQKNVGVAESCYELGRYFEDSAEKGNFNSSEETFQIAAMWYVLGHQCQHTLSTNALALMYIKGKGVPKNEKAAEKYLQFALNLKYHPAYVHMADLYMEQMEYEKAKFIIESGLDLKDDFITPILLKMFIDIDKNILEAKKQIKEIVKFEASYNLIAEGFPYRDRLKRVENMIKYGSQELHEKLHLGKFEGEGKVFLSTGNIIDSNHNKGRCMLVFHFDDLLLKNICGYKHAKKLWETQAKYCQVIKLVEMYSKSSCLSTLTTCYENAREFILLLLNFFELDYAAIKWQKFHLDKLYLLLNEITKVKFSQQCALFSRALAVCIAQISAMLEDSEESFKLLIKAWTFYPDDVQLSVTLANHYADRHQFDKAYIVGAEALERYPDFIDLLFNHAQICLRVTPESHIGPPTKMKAEAIKHFTNFLRLAPSDHPKVPETYYSLGKGYYDMYKESEEVYEQLIITVARHFLLLGTHAEENQAACFLPYCSLLKDTLRSIAKQDTDTEIYQGQEPFYSLLHRPIVGNQKGELPKNVSKMDEQGTFDSYITPNLTTDKTRVDLIVRHRNDFMRELRKMGNKEVHVQCKSDFKEGWKRILPVVPTGLKPLTIDEALVPIDKTWRGRSMYLTVIDETMSGFGLEGIHVIVEDENGNAGHVLLFDIPQDDSIQRHFGFGCKIYLLDPHVASHDGHRVIVGGPYSVFPSKKDSSLCRYCLKPGAKTSCSRCKWANYCNKECQSKDWTIRKHKKICVVSPPWNKDLHKT